MTKRIADFPAAGSLDDLGRLWGMNRRQVEYLAGINICVKISHGKYDVGQSTRGLLEHLRKRSRPTDPKDDPAAATALLRRAQAQRVELANAIAEGRLVPAAEARQCWQQICRYLQKSVMALPAAAAFHIPGLMRSDVEIIERICRDALEDASMGRGFTLGGEPSPAESTSSALPAA